MACGHVLSCRACWERHVAVKQEAKKKPGKKPKATTVPCPFCNQPVMEAILLEPVVTAGAAAAALA